MKRIVTAITGLLLLLIMSGQLTAAAQEETIAKTNLKVGDVAPDFTLTSNKW